jgi:hypothetical protein
MLTEGELNEIGAGLWKPARKSLRYLAQTTGAYGFQVSLFPEKEVE